MSYEIELIKKDQLQVSKWSGGTTIQLAIFPKSAIYSERNFKWRLSSARVEVEESTFTSLPNIKRIIMVIEGKLLIEHEGHYKSILEPFDQDYFSGNWLTKSYGKVSDFNLMMSEDCEGELEDLHLEKGQSRIISFNKKRKSSQNLQALYCINGQAKIEILTDDMVILNESDILLVTSNDDISDLNLEIFNEKDKLVNLIRANIHY